MQGMMLVLGKHSENFREVEWVVSGGHSIVFSAARHEGLQLIISSPFIDTAFDLYAFRDVECCESRFRVVRHSRKVLDEDVTDEETY